MGLEIAVFAIATCITPGPVNIVATISGAQNGLRANLPFVTGATLGLSFVIMVSGFGVSQVLKTNETLANVITLIGSVYILYLAFLMCSRRVEIKASDGTHQTPNFIQGSILQIINPKAWLVSMSGLAMYLTADQQSLLALYVTIFTIACFASVFLWVCLGHLIASRLKVTYLTTFTRVMAIVLSILVLYNLAGTFTPNFS